MWKFKNSRSSLLACISGVLLFIYPVMASSNPVEESLKARLQNVRGQSNFEIAETARDNLYLLAKNGHDNEDLMFVLETLPGEVCSLFGKQWNVLFDFVHLKSISQIKKHKLERENPYLYAHFLTDSKQPAIRLKQSEEIRDLYCANMEDSQTKIWTLERMDECLSQSAVAIEMEELLWNTALKDHLVSDCEVRKIFHEFLYKFSTAKTTDKAASERLQVRIHQLVADSDNLRKHDFLLQENMFGKELLRHLDAVHAAALVSSIANRMQELGVEKEKIAPAYFFAGCAYLLSECPLKAKNSFLDARRCLNLAKGKSNGLSVRIHLCLAETYRRLNEFKHAISSLQDMRNEVQQQAEIPPVEIEAYANAQQGRILAQEGKYQPALESLKESEHWFKDLGLEKHMVDYGNRFMDGIVPGPLEVLQWTGDALDKTGNSEEAKREYELKNRITADMIPARTLPGIHGETQKMESHPSSIGRETQSPDSSEAQNESRLRQWTLKHEIDKAHALAISSAYAANGEYPMSSTMSILVAFNLIEAGKFQLAREVLEHLPFAQEESLASRLRLLLRSYCYKHIGHASFAQSLQEQALFKELEIKENNSASVEQRYDADISRTLIVFFAERIALEANNQIRAERYHAMLKDIISNSSIAQTVFARRLLG